MLAHELGLPHQLLIVARGCTGLLLMLLEAERWNWRLKAADWRTKYLSRRKFNNAASGADLLMLQVRRKLQRLSDRLQLYHGHARRSIGSTIFRISFGGWGTGSGELGVSIFRFVEACGGDVVMAAVLD